MKVHTNTPDLFIAGTRRIGCALPAILLSLGIIWGMMAILTLDEGVGNKMFAMVFFSIFVIWFLAMGLGSVYRNQLTMDRKSRQVEIRLARFTGVKTTPFDLAHVARAELGPSRYSTNPARVVLRNAHVVLVVDQGMDAGSYQITRLVKARKDAQALADAINDWLGQ